eukprot:gene4558-5680_t
MNSDRKCTVLYATESGTSQEVAEKLCRDLSNYDFKPVLFDIQNYNKIKLPEEKLVIFVLSTAGHGEVPDSMKKFWSFLLIKTLPANSLINTKFAVLGLGDSSYTTYNYAAKKLYQRLVSLSATPIIRRGDADDQHDLGIDYEVEKWTRELIENLLIDYPLPQDFQIPDSNTLHKSKFTVTFLETEDKSVGEYKYRLPPQSNYSVGKLTKNTRITANDWEQDVRHLEIELPTNLTYKSGDVAYILPQNPDDKVDQIIGLLKLNPDLIITKITPNDPDLTQKPIITLPISVRDLFKTYFDIMGSPRRYVFQLLSFFVSTELEKERASYFSSKEGQDDLRTYNQLEKRNIIDVLTDFTSASIPFDYLFDLITPIKPRPFSISSSPNLYPNHIHITAGLHWYVTPFRKIKKMGLVSQWFQSLELGSSIPLYIKESGASLPKSSLTPIIMIGPGTGCAMFRSFMQERQLVFEKEGKIGTTIFYFGCRHQSKDYLYEEELKSLVDTGVLSKLEVAFSRDSANQKKVYVQHLMKLDSAMIWNLIEKENVHIYVSGSSGKMPKDVRAALITIIREHGGFESYESAQNYFVQKLESTKRYITETW